jgi:hypothetical protein
MGFFVSQEGTRIEVKDREGNVGGVWIRQTSEAEVRERTSKLLGNQNLGASLMGNRMGNDLANQIKIDGSYFTEMRRDLMENHIVRWDFTDENGDEVPVNPETIAQLDQFVSNQIYEAIQGVSELPEDERDENGEVKEEHPISGI